MLSCRSRDFPTFGDIIIVLSSFHLLCIYAEFYSFFACFLHKKDATCVTSSKYCPKACRYKLPGCRSLRKLQLRVRLLNDPFDSLLLTLEFAGRVVSAEVSVLHFI